MGRIFDFVANSRDGVFAVDSNQRIVLWNARATAILGFTSEDVLGARCYQVLHGRDGEGCPVCRHDCTHIQSARSLEPAAARDVVVRTKAGDEAWLNVSTVVVPSRCGEVSALIYFFREVTRDREVAAAARKLAKLVVRESVQPKQASAGKFGGTEPGSAVRWDGAQPWPGSPEEHHPPWRPPDSSLNLTPREQEILSYLKMGLSTQDIASRVSISARTVRNHVTNILAKLGVHSRLQAVAYSIENRLV